MSLFVASEQLLGKIFYRLECPSVKGFKELTNLFFLRIW